MKLDKIKEEMDTLKSCIEFTESLILYSKNQLNYPYFLKKVETYKKELRRIIEEVKMIEGGEQMSKVYNYFLAQREFEGPGYTTEEALEDMWLHNQGRTYTTSSYATSAIQAIKEGNTSRAITLLETLVKLEDSWQQDEKEKLSETD
jgi:hypothetical protein